MKIAIKTTIEVGPNPQYEGVAAMRYIKKFLAFIGGTIVTLMVMLAAAMTVIIILLIQLIARV